jgi:hypothetical protein
VGYAAVSFRNEPHPDDASDSEAKVLVLSMFGINQAFHGQTNPFAAGQSYAASIMTDLEEQARSKANCVALKLWVRSTNARAIGFYRLAAAINRCQIPAAVAIAQLFQTRPHGLHVFQREAPVPASRLIGPGEPPPLQLPGPPGARARLPQQQ